jgi:hypothetical protein
VKNVRDYKKFYDEMTNLAKNPRGKDPEDFANAVEQADSELRLQALEPKKVVRAE